MFGTIAILGVIVDNFVSSVSLVRTKLSYLPVNIVKIVFAVLGSLRIAFVISP